MRRTTVTVTALLLLMVLALPTIGGCEKEKDTPENPIATDEAVFEDDAGSGGKTGDGDGGVPLLPANATDGSAPAAAPNAPTTLTVRLAWVEAGENALSVERSIPYTQAVATAAMSALLAGPTPEEQAAWPAIGTAIPAGTRLLGLSVSNGVAKVDLSGEFASGGGSFSVTARLAQVVYTLTQFSTIQSVEFYMEGVRIEMFSAEGLLLEGPQTIEDYQQLLPMDA